MTEKEQVRKRALLARRGMRPEEREEASRRIVSRIAGSDVFRKAATVLIYQAMPDEVDLSGLNGCPGSDGKRICYPHVLGSGKMEALLPRGPEGWRKGSFGIMEPDPETSEHVRPEEFDLILCPCTAFDEDGRRMGMGGGYYDRYLPRCDKAVIAAVAFEAQKLPSIPTEDTDVCMELVFTEREVYGRKA